MKQAYEYRIGTGEGMDSAGAGLVPLSPLSLPPDDRPREKIIKDGAAALSDRELLAALLVSGVKGRNVSALAEDLLELLEREKGAPGVDKLSALTGMGRSKACTVAAMLEFGRRRWAAGQRAKTPRDIYNLVRHYADRRQERLLSVSLNGALEVLGIRICTVGLVNRTIVHPREVLADPLLDRASAVVVAHNHPSGELRPSGEDTSITTRLKNAANLLGLQFLDHIIFSDSGFFSYRHAGMLRD